MQVILPYDYSCPKMIYTKSNEKMDLNNLKNSIESNLVNINLYISLMEKMTAT